jgi:regulator of RNase E activity RraB
MPSFNSFRQHLYRFFSKKDRDESLGMQSFLNKKVLELGKKFGAKENAFQSVEFFFYSDEEDKANNLVIELARLGYEVYAVYPPELEDQQWSVIGCTIPMNLQEGELTNWSEQMVKLGYECDCKFDGWGSLIE